MESTLGSPCFGKCIYIYEYGVSFHRALLTNSHICVFRCVVWSCVVRLDVEVFRFALEAYKGPGLENQDLQFGSDFGGA